MKHLGFGMLIISVIVFGWLVSKPVVEDRTLRLAAAVVAILCGLSLAACAEDPLTEGTVIERRFIPAHDEDYTRTEYRTEWYTENVCTSQYNGPNGSYSGQSCSPVSRTRMVPYYVQDTRHVPDDWDIRIKHCELENSGREKCKRQWKDVSEEVYEQCKQGRLWREETACDLR